MDLIHIGLDLVHQGFDVGDPLFGASSVQNLQMFGQDGFVIRQRYPVCRERRGGHVSARGDGPDGDQSAGAPGYGQRGGLKLYDIVNINSAIVSRQRQQNPIRPTGFG